jgi:hypothetical protein
MSALVRQADWRTFMRAIPIRFVDPAGMIIGASARPVIWEKIQSVNGG